MPPKPIAAMSDAFRIVEYDTRFKAHPPAKPKGHEDDPLLLDKHATVATNRWVYPLVSLYKSGNNFHIPFEARIEEEGIVLQGSPKSDPKLPIPKRAETFLFDPDALHQLAFPKLDNEGRALMVRLFLSPFRLSKAAAKVLCGESFQQGARKHIPSLWDWKSEPVSAVKSADGLYLAEHDTWLTVNGTRERVWAGVDPFQVARRRSDIFVQRRTRFIKRFEPTKKTQKSQWAKDQLMLALNDAIVSNDKIDAKYKQAIDEIRVMQDFADYEEERVRLLKRINVSANKLVEILDSPFFALLQYGSLDAECFEDGADYSEALAEHIATLDHVLRMFDECAQGLDLMNRWAREAEKSEVHFINKVVMPARNVPLHVFKTVRWMGKSTVSLIRNLWPKIIATLRLSADDLVTPLANLGIVPSVEAAVKAIKDGTLDLAEISDALNLKLKNSSVKTRVFGETLVEALAEYANLDKSGVEPAGFSKADVGWSVVFAALDLVNLCFAVNAVSKTKDVHERLQAQLSVGAASGFFAASVLETMLKIDQATSQGIPAKFRLGATRAIAATRGICGVVYAALDFADAIEAGAKGDNDRKIALIVAGTAELCASYIAFSSMLAGVAVMTTPLAIAGVVAAVAYTAATFLKDDPLEKYLMNCEYADSPYEEPDFAPIWAIHPVSKWKEKFIFQRKLLLSVLTRFSMSWDRADPKQKFILGVQIGCSMRTPDMRIVVRFVAEFADGSKIADKHVLEGETLPMESAVPIIVTTKNFLDHSAHTVTAFASMTIRREGFEHQLAALIVKDGKSIQRGERNRFK